VKTLEHPLVLEAAAVLEKLAELMAPDTVVMDFKTI
jgi:hypothetical protein